MPFVGDTLRPLSGLCVVLSDPTLREAGWRSLSESTTDRPWEGPCPTLAVAVAVAVAVIEEEERGGLGVVAMTVVVSCNEVEEGVGRERSILELKKKSLFTRLKG